MTSQPDKLFRDALENFQRPAPIDAWKKIDATLDKSSNKGLWLKIAAGLLLLCVAGFLLWTTGNNTEKAISVTADKNKPVERSVESNQKGVATPLVTDNQKTESENIPLKKKNIRKTNPVLLAKSEPTNETIHVVPSPTEVMSPVVAVAEVEPLTSQPSRMIVFTADEVNAKYLRKKATVEATPEPKKSSGIQKLMGLAYEIKNTENGLGELRQKKNEILALNFLNEDKTKKEKN